MGKHRGDSWEAVIEKANKYYRTSNIALIQKIATPMNVIRKGKEITGAFYSKKSTVDFIGVYCGKAICFDAKEFKEVRGFPLKNVHEHQYEYMRDFEDNGGKSYLLIHSVSNDMVYVMSFELLQEYYLLHEQHKGEKGFANIPMNILNGCCNYIEHPGAGIIDYINLM